MRVNISNVRVFFVYFFTTPEIETGSGLISGIKVSIKTGIGSESIMDLYLSYIRHSQEVFSFWNTRKRK